MLPDDAAFAALDEFDEGPDLHLGLGRFLEFLESHLQFQPRAVQQSVRAAYVQDLLGGETPPLQPYRVDAVRHRRPSHRQHIGRNVASHRDGFAKYVAVADFEQRGLALVFLVLRRVAQGRELKNLVAGADARRSVDHRVRADPGAGADDHIRTDDRERTDLNVRRQLRLRRYHRARIDHPASPFAFEPVVSGATMISADATSTPSTSANP